jgi:hypothetical protein
MRKPIKKSYNIPYPKVATKRSNEDLCFQSISLLPKHLVFSSLQSGQILNSLDRQALKRYN